ncbi:hypothetical protein [Erythrobacter sp.]|uniref:cupin domain-containing protein n=1 Tax=Erythrobacter sp. TaxID=1042 RepID=UPI001B0D9001|nr:hypothetical protein [Erythrobacter sp.]MBO6526948.1 hypothetical protein [Erythrobacter sp.]MBO6528620.1 hypothetical protein [Erythrobacter sp.]
MFNKIFHSLATVGLCFTASAAAAQNVNPAEQVVTAEILKRFVDDYNSDPMAIDATFGIEVGEHRWRVTSKMIDNERSTSLDEGFGAAEMMYYTLDQETLHLIDRKVWTGLTAMAAATSADETPLEVEFTSGYEQPADYEEIFRRLTFHFWNRGFPEITRYGPENSRIAHGAPATVLYYDKAFRSAVYHVPAGLGKDQAPTLAAPFPRMIIVLSGAVEGEMGEHNFVAKPGEMFLTPPNIPVTFWNASKDETLSFVWIAWGEGA